ncbi:MAG TPA: TlpA disulfide reductase family protein [Parasegetibacter sp.]|jgi:peroxiredoxin
MRLLITLLFFGLSFQLSAQDNSSMDSTTLAKAGHTIPDFSFEIEKGKTVQIKDYRGKVLVINFFATWCGPCRTELPVLHKQVWEKYKDNKDFALFIFGREEGWDKIDPFKSSNNFTFPMLPDEERKIYSLFATQFIPRTLIIDKDGKIVYHSIGYNPEEFKKFEEKLASLL